MLYLIRPIARLTVEVEDESGGTADGCEAVATLEVVFDAAHGVPEVENGVGDRDLSENNSTQMAFQSCSSRVPSLHAPSWDSAYYLAGMPQQTLEGRA